MTRRPHLSVTPMGLAYVSGDWHDRDSAHHAENALRTCLLYTSPSPRDS